MLVDCPNIVTVLPCINGVEIRGAELYEGSINGQFFGWTPCPCQQWSKNMLSCLNSTAFQPLPCKSKVWLHLVGEPYPNRLDPECRDIKIFAFEMLPGDLNLDGTADFTDFMLYRGTFIQLQWDWNRDSVINLADMSDLYNAITLRVVCP